MRTPTLYSSFPVFLFLLFRCSGLCAEVYAGMHSHKVVWVDSYHKGYAWSDGVERGIRKGLAGKNIELVIHRMDTKRKSCDNYCQQAGLQAKKVLDQIKPDLVIATDDNAQKFLVVPYLKDTDLPVVFSGVNWDAEEYGYPSKNITGMVEIDHIGELVALMEKDAKGNRIGYLSTNVPTARKNADAINRLFFENQMQLYMVSTFDAFKQQFLRAQEEVDMLIIYNDAGIKGWDDMAAETFLAQHTRIPTCSTMDFMNRFSVYTNSKSPDEQGEYAATVAVQILAGKKPDAFPLVRNKKSHLTVNLKMAKAAGIVVPLPVLKTAEILGKEAYSPTNDIGASGPQLFQHKKVVWVDSYHQGYEWSDGIQRGIQEVLGNTKIALTILHMDTKRNTSAAFAKRSAAHIMQEIKQIHPDAVIASDDNAQKYLVVPYLAQEDIPVLFCGVNTDASMYGYPTVNITGMLEVEPIHALLKLLRTYGKIERVGYLCSEMPTEHKKVAYYQKNVFPGLLTAYFFKDFASFKQVFLQAQENSDALIIPDNTGIIDWDPAAAEEFIQENVRLPTGSFMEHMSRYVVFTIAQVPEEQGRYAAQTVLRIFQGEKMSNIPITINTKSTMMINVKMAEAAGIVVPVSMLKQAEKIIGQEVFWQE